MEATVGNLVALTREFFAKHWNADAIGCAPPEWSGEYRFVGWLQRTRSARCKLRVCRWPLPLPWPG